MGHMGLFQHRKDDEENQWTLPSEPLVREGADVLRIHDRSSLQAVRVAGRIRRRPQDVAERP